MSSQASAGSRSALIIVAVVILAILGILAVIAGVLYFAEPARSLPSVLGTITHPASRAKEHRPIRGVTAIIVGVILLAAAGLGGWFRGRKPAVPAAPAAAPGDGRRA